MTKRIGLESVQVHLLDVAGPDPVYLHQVAQIRPVNPYQTSRQNGLSDLLITCPSQLINSIRCACLEGFEGSELDSREFLGDGAEVLESAGSIVMY